jgi:hypothetical protein
MLSSGFITFVAVERAVGSGFSLAGGIGYSLV